MSDETQDSEQTPGSATPGGTEQDSSTGTDEVFDGELVLPETVDSSDGVTSGTPGQPTSDRHSPTTGGYFPPQVSDPHYSESGVPTFDFVRDKIENRVTTAIGSQELAEGSAEGRDIEDKMRKRDEAAKKRLEEIRKSMGS